jgi:hypothetical protein
VRPPWISPSSAIGLPPAGSPPAGGIGGAGGPAPGGGGGGGGGAPGAPIPGIGGGGGALGGAPMPGIGGGGGGAGGAPVGAGDSAVGDVTPGLTGEKARVSSAAERGRGGAMVPNSIEASWRAFPAPGPSSSSDESSRSEPTTDHSSSSGRTREGLAPVWLAWIGSGDLAAACC